MKKQLTINFAFEPEASFEYFYPADNALLVANLKQFINLESQQYSRQLLYIHGASGCGKSHILQAICHFADELGKTAQYLPAEQLMQLPKEFTLGLESNDLLVIDDVDLLVSDYDWQQALFDLINRCLEQGCKLLFSAKLPASDVGFELPDLISRLNWGEIWLLKPLSDVQRQAMLQLRSEARGIPMSDDLASYIVLRCQQDNASILKCLERLDKESLTEKRRLTIPFVKNVMGW
ncbi:DnaA regulatory inactivator Hda [Catenovulum sp. 2E275]|uniref:DnaA regulatory inactivator Hda n=1 Tax=Catenovulum sp. 2E275 TaxID=2980497 RepID=UPI0021D337A1|nr:DnaA regulatory inactivator Hda [Catenovulum sp. 2E275]MCU4674689.1 DnaA regulatory inactivator Hda [Catenovulum sp. 2E275]